MTLITFHNAKRKEEMKQLPTMGYIYYNGFLKVLHDNNLLAIES